MVSNAACVAIRVVSAAPARTEAAAFFGVCACTAINLPALDETCKLSISFVLGDTIIPFAAHHSVSRHTSSRRPSAATRACDANWLAGDSIATSSNCFSPFLRHSGLGTQHGTRRTTNTHVHSHHDCILNFKRSPLRNCSHFSPSAGDSRSRDSSGFERLFRHEVALHGCALLRCLLLPVLRGSKNFF